MTDVILSASQYGKAENRVVRVVRDTDRHEGFDLNVTSQLRGDDTQKNTIFTFARDGISSPEAFLLRLAEHFTSEFDWVTGGRWAADQYGWSRINDHDHAFYRGAPEVRTAVLVRDNGTDTMFSGFYDLTVMKTTQSGFVGYPKDKYTTLQETEDRILATDVSTKWRYSAQAGEVDYNGIYASVKQTMLSEFSQGYSHALQQDLYDMAAAVIDQHPEIDEVRFSCPSKHHFLTDLSFCGLENPGEVFYAADRPYGLIEASVQRKSAASADGAWMGIAGFC